MDKEKRRMDEKVAQGKKTLASALANFGLAFKTGLLRRKRQNPNPEKEEKRIKNQREQARRQGEKD